MKGGYSGNQPSVDAATAQSAISQLRTQLETKARAAISALQNDSMTVFPGLAMITYQDLPSTVDTDGKTAHINENVHVVVPVFPASIFAQTVAQLVSADTAVGDVRIIPESGYGAAYADASSTPNLGGPIGIALSGTAQIVWNVDAPTLAKAVAGRDSSAFQTIISSFPGVEEARAHIEPFWQNSFPADPSSIRINVLKPAANK
jgi:hypothetical protein